MLLCVCVCLDESCLGPISFQSQPLATTNVFYSHIFISFPQHRYDRISCQYFRVWLFHLPFAVHTCCYVNSSCILLLSSGLWYEQTLCLLTYQGRGHWGCSQFGAIINKVLHQSWEVSRWEKVFKFSGDKHPAVALLSHRLTVCFSFVRNLETILPHGRPILHSPSDLGKFWLLLCVLAGTHGLYAMVSTVHP